MSYYNKIRHLPDSAPEVEQVVFMMNTNHGDDMNNIPLHPMIVHFPIVLSVLLPVVALIALWAMHRSSSANLRIWAIPAALAVVLAASAFVANRTGENEEERVEDVVPENAIHRHEEAAERFLVIAAVVAAVALAGLATGVFGSAARFVTMFGSLVIVLAGFQVGKAGGELVYEHNAASVYARDGAQAGVAAEDTRQGGRNEQDSDAR